MRTQVEIQNNIDETLPPATSGLAGYWRFNDASGTTATDGTANANHGTLGGGVVARQPAWTASDVPFGKVDVELLDGATPVALLADDTLNDGEFVWTIPEATPPGTNYRIRVTRVGTAVTDTSNAAFTVTLPITVYYVNDGTVEAGDWTTAPGNDANDGLSAATPKSSIRAVLETYDLDAGDVVRVDAGTYAIGTNIILAANDAGVKIEGYHEAAFPTRRALINRGNVTAGSFAFELQNADDVILDYLHVTGGQQGIYASASSDSDRVTITNSVLFGNSSAGVYLEGTNDFATVSGNRFFGVLDNASGNDNQPYGVILTGNDGTVTLNTLIGGGSNEGITVGGLRHTVTGNDVSGHNSGIYAYSAGPGADRTTVSGNRAHDNASWGIYASGNILVIGNDVFGQEAQNAHGMYIAASEARGNLVHDNWHGLQISGSLVEDNTIYNQLQTGVNAYDSAVLRGNRIYDSATGVYVAYNYSGEVVNNLIYDQRTTGVLVEAYFGLGTRITGNTIYQPGGADAVRLQANTLNVTLVNNILWVGGGYALSVDPNSQRGLVSDYNLFYTTGTGKLALWENRDFTSRVDWFYEVGFDEHSRVADPLFVNPAGADGILGYRAGGLSASYYNNINWTDPPVLTRIEPLINMNLGGASPQPGTVNADNFSVRWQGQVFIPADGQYTFYTQSDDGEQFFVDGNLLINQLVWDGGLENSTTLVLTAGWHTIRYDLRENTGMRGRSCVGAVRGSPSRSSPSRTWRLWAVRHRSTRARTTTSISCPALRRSTPADCSITTWKSSSPTATARTLLPMATRRKLSSAPNRLCKCSHRTGWRSSSKGSRCRSIGGGRD